jgi:hypothetical protein
MSKRNFLFCSVFFSLMLCSCFEIQAQNTKRGFKLLEKSDYTKAYEQFSEAVSENKEDPAALLGMTLILADTNAPNFDLVNAWKCASVLNANIEKLTTEEQEYIGAYFYNTELRHISRPVKKKIEYAVETVEAKLIKYIREENNLDLVYQVLKEFPDFRYYDNVMHIRNQLEFRKYEKQNTLEGYLEFIRKFPDAAQIEKAVKYRNKLAFENACKINTVNAYNEFLDNYPDAVEMNLAVKKMNAVAFQQAKQANTIQAMDRFMNEYPEALEISEAKLIQKQLLYEYAKKIKTLQAYNEFIRKYPEGQLYVDIFNLKSMDNGTRFLGTHPFPTGNILWARSFEEEENEELTSCLVSDTLNAYVMGSTIFRRDTGSTDAWIIKVSTDGRMLWNKYVGEAYNDEVKILCISKKNEIFGAGYTWTGTDSSSRESWVFKLGGYGQKLWSKKLGNMNINSMTISSSGSVFLGGYVMNDSLQALYSVVVLNENGKRMWGRTYTGKGEIIRIAELPDQKILLAGNNWRAKVDPKGYLIWESSFNSTDSIIAAQVIQKGDICYLGTRNKTKYILIKTNSDNKLLLEKELTLPEIPSALNSMVAAGSNQLVTLITFDEHQSVNWINTQTGVLTNSARVPNGVRADQLITDRSNNLLIVACNGEIILIKNNGLTF